MPKIFRLPYTIALYDTDAAQIIFYANLFRICQHALEGFLADIGFGLPVLFGRRTMGLPVVHAEGDFEQMLTVGMKVEIRAHVAQIGSSSYRMAYELWSEDGRRMATAATVQVCVDPKTGASMPLPDDFRQALTKYA
ncbi:MAG TPA: thioesterase family protein [bacterium]|jgi:YbgC/YbaW family acyl-CoA thioester hydrolase